MTLTHLSTLANQHLHRLCVEIPRRSVGSPGNREATSYFAEKTAACEFQVETPQFECIYWTQEGARLTAQGHSFQVQVSPYSLSCHAQAPLAAASNLDELQAVNATGKILLLRGELTREQLMPKNFPFYYPEEHQRIHQLLEAKNPRAIIAATTRNPELAGALYPFPLIEDGNIDIPSAYLTEDEGNKLIQFIEKPVLLTVLSRRTPATGCNVVARKNPDAKRRLVFTAHIDAKESTPGALDNAAGVVTLLLLAELLKDYAGHLGVEIVAINGEDYFAAPGEILYLQQNQGRMDDILLNINLDGVGYHQGPTACSFYECPEAVSALALRVFSAHPGMSQGEQWYQGDHMLFVQSGVPALAITSQDLMEIETRVAHTPKDTPDLVDPARLASLALALRDLTLALDAFETQLT